MPHIITDNLGVAPSSKSESEMPNGEFKGQEIKNTQEMAIYQF